MERCYHQTFVHDARFHRSQLKFKFLEMAQYDNGDICWSGWRYICLLAAGCYNGIFHQSELTWPAFSDSITFNFSHKITSNLVAKVFLYFII